jgi:peptide/nickel transport system substrate-binding protein
MPNWTSSESEERQGRRSFLKKRTKKLLFVGAAVSLGIHAAWGAGDRLVIGVSQFPDGLNPTIAGQAVLSYAAGFALRPITTFDHQGHVVCLLCTEVPALENGLARREGDGLAVTIRLAPNLAWGDGVPVTSRDVAFTWKLQHDPAGGFVAAYPWWRATAVDLPDENTAVLHLDRTYTSFQLWGGVLSEHVEGAVVQAAATPADYINHTLYNRAPATPGLWDGPYMPESYRINQSIDYVPNPHWAGTTPGFAHLVLRLVDNTAALQANLLSGDVDMTPSGTGISIDQAISLQKDHADRFRFIFKPQLVYEHLEAQLANPILQDRNVREALLRGIDVNAIVAKLFGGHAEVARSFLNELDPHYTPDVPTYPYDPARARALLDGAGWTPGPDGIRRNAKGERLSLEFTTTSGNRARELTQQVMQSQWRAIGVETTVHNFPSRAFFGETLKRREYTGLAEFASVLQPLLVPWSRLSSRSIPSAANNWSGQNYSGVNDARLDALIDMAQYELDGAKQQTIWREIQTIYATQLYGLPLYFGQDPDVLPTWLAGYDTIGKETYPPYFAEAWRHK